MSYLDQFTEEQKQLLISLPYRAGLMVSESDTEGGEESLQAEMQALESIITGFAEDFLKSEFVEEVMRQTLAHKDRWVEWGKQLDTVPADCEKAMNILAGQLEARDVLSFRQNLMEIALSVAMAYREFDEDGVSTQKMSAYLRYYWSCFMARLKKEQMPDMDNSLNISRGERGVLSRLSKALQVDFEGNPINSSMAA